MVETNAYSAAPSALGYLAQVEYALLLVLRRLDQVLEFDIALETLDDIVFHDGESDLEQLQAKHRVDRTASLTNGSPDIWKTLHNWIDAAGPDATLTLFTNATAAQGTAAAHLRPGVERNVNDAHTILAAFAENSKNKAQQKYYESFLELGSDERMTLLDRVTVLDGQPSVADLEAEFQLTVKKAVIRKYRSSLVKRMREWWNAKVLNHLTRIAAGESDRISSSEVEEQLLTIAQTLRDDNLPIDFYDTTDPTPGEVKKDERAFVKQLRLISLANERLRQCIFDHNRAFAQRSKWEREQLLPVGELKKYEDRLREEWRRYCLPETDDKWTEESAAVADARERFLRLERADLPRIRTQVSASYVANGSIHMLADRLEIGWHPDWRARMRELFPELDRAAEDVA